jgi:hypothetical protein
MWFQVCNIALGIWLLVAPAVLPTTPEAATIERIAGPVVIFFAVLALRDVTRPFRAVNVLAGMFLAIAPWVIVHNTGVQLLNTELVAWAVIVCALVRGPVHRETGSGWWAVVNPRAEAAVE